MGMVIQDDFWQACQALPAKQQAPFMLAIVEYGFTGKEPAGRPAWLPTFIVIRDRIRMSAEASEKGRRMAAARWGKHDAAEHAQAYATAYAQASCTGDTEDMHKHDAESENEDEIEIPPYNPPYALQCLDAFNSVMGTTYTTLPANAARTLERLNGKYPVEDVKAMVAHMRSKWEGTRYAAGLTPKKLFGSDDFEAFMHQSRSESKEEADYAKYDR